jgi:pantothenate kinase type III
MSNPRIDRDEQGYFWDEALPEMIEQFDWSGVSPEQWDTISNALNEHVSNSREFMAPVPSSQDIFEMNERPRRSADAERIADLEAAVAAYGRDIIRVKGGSYTTIENGRVAIYDR